MANQGGRRLIRDSGAEAREHPPVVDGYLSYNQPAPVSFSDPLFVVIPGGSADHPYKVERWGAIHGKTLPAQGAQVSLTVSDQGIPTAIWWEGTYS